MLCGSPILIVIHVIVIYSFSAEKKMPTGKASALLQKVNSQLRGERVPLKSKEEDELAVSFLKTFPIMLTFLILICDKSKDTKL